MFEAPPSYDSIVKPLIAQTNGKEITIRQINAYAESLSPDQKVALAESPKPDPKNLDPADIKAYQDKIQTDLLSPDAVEKFKQAARDAVDASKGIDATFMNLYALLAKIDSENGLTGTDKFLPTFGNIQNSWRQILKDSRILAADVAVTAKSFDQDIMPVVADPTLDKDTKLEIIAAEREGTQEYQKRAEGINTRLGQLVDDFEKFVGTFGAWGKDKLGQLNGQIEDAQHELDQLLEQAKALTNCMIGMGVAVGVSALVAVGGFFAGPLAPVFWVAGALMSLSFGMGLLAVGLQYKNCMDEIDAKKNEINGLQKQVSDIEKARTELQTTGKDDVAFIQAHIGAVTGIWTCLDSDLEQIVQWIKQGENMENNDKIPPIIRMGLVQNKMANASAIYAKVAEYLTEYSTGMKDSGIPDPK